jgi:hypothetical protein
MLPKLKEAEYHRDYRIWLHFADGVEGEIDLGGELWGEVFEPLKKDKIKFAGFVLDKELGIVWPNGADFAPELLHVITGPS